MRCPHACRRSLRRAAPAEDAPHQQFEAEEAWQRKGAGNVGKRHQQAGQVPGQNDDSGRAGRVSRAKGARTCHHAARSQPLSTQRRVPPHMKVCGKVQLTMQLPTTTTELQMNQSSRGWRCIGRESTSSGSNTCGGRNRKNGRGPWLFCWLAGHKFQHRRVDVHSPQRAKHDVAVPSPPHLDQQVRQARQQRPGGAMQHNHVPEQRGKAGQGRGSAVKGCPPCPVGAQLVAGPLLPRQGPLILDAPPRPHLTVMRIHIVNEMKRERKSEPSANEMKPRTFGSDCCLGRAGKAGGHENKAQAHIGADAACRRAHLPPLHFTTFTAYGARKGLMGRAHLHAQRGHRHSKVGKQRDDLCPCRRVLCGASGRRHKLRLFSSCCALASHAAMPHSALLQLQPVAWRPTPVPRPVGYLEGGGALHARHVLQERVLTHIVGRYQLDDSYNVVCVKLGARRPSKLGKQRAAYGCDEQSSWANRPQAAWLAAWLPVAGISFGPMRLANPATCWRFVNLKELT